MGSNSVCSRNFIGIGIGVMASADVHDKLDGGSFSNEFLRIEQMGKEVDLLCTVLVGIPFWVLGEHEPPIIALFLPIVSRRNWKGTVTIHGSDWGRGRVRQLNWSVSGNGISLDLFKWRGIREKCRKKVVKDTGIFFGNFCLGRGRYPPCEMVWCGGCYLEHPKYELPQSGKEYGGDWERDLEGRYKNVKTINHMLPHFQCDLCHFKIRG